MRILCPVEIEIRDQNIISMAAEDFAQRRELRERFQVDLLNKCKDRLLACIEDIVNKVKAERAAYKELRDLLKRSLDGVQGMVDDASKMTDRMKDALARPLLLGNETLLEALKSQERCVACLREWMAQTQDWHQRSLKSLEVTIEGRSAAIEEYLDCRWAIEDWDFEMTSTTEAVMLFASTMDTLEHDANVTSVVLPAQLIEPFPVVGFCKEDPAPFGTVEGNAQVAQAFQKLREWQADATQTFCDAMNAVTASIIRGTDKLMAAAC